MCGCRPESVSQSVSIFLFPAPPVLEVECLAAVLLDALKGDREKCLGAGMNDYLSKPFTAEELYSVLSIWLGREPEPAANEDLACGQDPAADSA